MAAGNLYVADTGDDRVLKYNTPFQKTAVAGSGDTVADMIFGLSSFTVSPVLHRYCALQRRQYSYAAWGGHAVRAVRCRG